MAKSLMSSSQSSAPAGDGRDTDVRPDAQGQSLPDEETPYVLLNFAVQSGPKSESGNVLRMFFVENPQKQYSVQQLGTTREGSFLVAMPKTPDEAVVVKAGQVLEFQELRGTTFYKFRSEVVRACYEPFPYLHMSAPLEHSMQKHVLRAARRVNVHLPVSVAIGPKKTDVLQGFMIDLSTTGARITLDTRLHPVVNKLKLRFELTCAGKARKLELPASVKNHQTLEDRPSTVEVYGVAFDAVDDTVALILDAYAANRQVQIQEEQLYGPMRCNPPENRISGPAAEQAADDLGPDWHAIFDEKMPGLERQHKQMGRLINRIEAALKQRKGAVAVRGLFRDLLAVTRSHFHTEEVVMAKSSYNNTLQHDHEREHCCLLIDLERLTPKAEARAIPLVMLYLRTWMMRHMDTKDKTFADEISPAKERAKRPSKSVLIG